MTFPFFVDFFASLLYNEKKGVENMKKLLCILLALIFTVVLMSACGDKVSDGTTPTEEAPTEALPNDEEIAKAILGRWMGGEEGSRLGYQFNADGTGLAAFFPFTYTVENGIITITITAFGETQTGSAAYDVKGDTLTLTKDGELFELTRFTE